MEQVTQVTQKEWLKEQRREDIIAEILYKAKKTDLPDLRKIGWTNGFPDRYRTPAWQLLLHYLPVSKSKRETTLRRKRIEYHRHITKHYFEFDFCLTDRKLSSTSADNTSKRVKATLSPSSKRRLSLNSQLQQAQSDSLFQASLMPLFSQPSAPSKQSKNREDTLLLQIRDDINKMVKIPTSSSIISSRRSNSSKMVFNHSYMKHSKLLGVNTFRTQKESKKRMKKGKFTDPSNFEEDIHGEVSTTTNRLFANQHIKGSLERILYLWSIRIKNNENKKDQANGFPTTVMFSNSSSTSRYMPGMVDIVYPLYLINLHGFIWQTHLSTSMQKDEIDIRDELCMNSSNTTLNDVEKFQIRKEESFMMKLGMKSFNDGDDSMDREEEEKNQSEEKYQSEILEQEARELKVGLCKDLNIGKGIDLIPEEILDEVEADTFWCLENMMNAIQDYRYNDAFFEKNTTKESSSSSLKKSRFKLREKDGLQKMIILTEKVLQRVDPTLYTHLQSKGIEFQWFTFRWMNTLHVRTMNESCLIRLWDTCLCEEIDKNSKSFGLNYFTAYGFNSKRSKKRLHLSGFLSFQIYLCAALLHQMRDKILAEESFEELLFFLRNLSLDKWGEKEVSMLLSQAFVWKETFGNSENQLFTSATEQYGDSTISKWVQQKSHWPPRIEKPKSSISLKTILPKKMRQSQIAS